MKSTTCDVCGVTQTDIDDKALEFATVQDRTTFRQFDLCERCHKNFKQMADELRSKTEDAIINWIKKMSEARTVYVVKKDGE